jgi:hypothetical protein
MLDALEMFRERGTRDELGLATVRDAFSDLMFPGTGSLQRRARYFFFVPWMFRFFEAERVSSAQIVQRAWQFEVPLINALAESEDKDGIIGIQKRARLQRFPSSIYWNGLRRLGIRLYPGTQDDYCRGLDQYYREIRNVQHDDDGEPVGAVPRNWRSGLPAMPSGFPNSATTRLTVQEADYLAERIVAEVGSSLFAFFVRRFGAKSDLPFVWDHRIAAELPESLATQVWHARNFAEVMQGASILYNTLLARMPPHRESLFEELEESFDEWCAAMKMRSVDIQRWELSGMWRLLEAAGARISYNTRQFVESWVDLVRRSHSLADLLESSAAAELITYREHRLKHNLARLTNDDARQRWNGNSGLGRLEYRWRNALMILNDIVDGRSTDAGTS